jgi:hypothetical protein
MLQSSVVLVAAIGLVSLVLTLGFHQLHNETGIFAALSLAAWGILAFQADAITVVTETGATLTRTEPTLQYLSLGLAAVSLLAVFGSLTGRWPQEDNEI